MSDSSQKRRGITRRSLLKTGAAGAAVLALGEAASPVWGAGTGAIGDASASSAGSGAQTAFGNCWMCHKLCGMKVTLNADGRAEELHGIDGHPRGSAGPGTNGTLCPKGLSQLEKAYSPKRIKQPYIRKDGELQAATWEEAFSYAADRLQTFESTHGFEKFLNWEGWGTSGALFETLLKDFVGIPNHMPHPTPTCFGSMAVPGTLMGLGGGNIRWVDYPNTKYVLVWGRDPLETFSGQWEAKQLLDARDRGATIVTIDPVYTETAKKSDKWLPIKPRTDGALALAMAHVIIDEGLYDEEFVENYTHGFETYKAAVADKTPEWAAEKTGLDPADIRDVAIGFAKAAPSAGINSWTGLGQSPDFFKGAQNVVALLGLVGAIDRPGGQRWWKSMPLEDPFAVRGIELPHKAEGVPSTITGPGVEYATMIGKPVQNNVPKMIRNGDIRGMSVYYRNPLTSGATNEWLDALDQLDLFITIDAFWSELTRHADVVFPEASQLEKPMLGTGGHGAYPNQGWITGSRAAIEPQWDTKSGFDIVKGLADALGYGDSFPWEDEEAYFNDQLVGYGLTLEALEERDTFVVGDEFGYEKWKKAGFANGSDKFWFDLDKKAKLFAGLSKKVGVDIQSGPQWLEPGTLGKPVTAEHPLEMIDSRTVFFSHGGDQALDKPLEQLAESVGLEHKSYRGNYLFINPADATPRGIESGDMVAIESPHGVETLMAKVTEGIVPGTVNVEPYGFGLGSVQPDEEGANNMSLNSETDFDIVTGQVDRHIPIQVRKLGGDDR
ncbi:MULTISPECIES: molybdopterin-dependent oxidoreductase [Haloferax]|uniref:Molybdopterin-dependent oxidoreductase n=1 Tax=Haloferax marinum TaxID=2666143 RepID=A0A6A8GAS2_9EURY|nr:MULTISPECIES: molybdopterin-dependent oxidoreductase [Haloferax]KAB1190770.1 molybdopterin-dependent oxidoreductase [Haloferax sp. CBA1150]MRW98309.1 molybdopterin-dependent oxidoreductase [Haloferax marinum]